MSKVTLLDKTAFVHAAQDELQLTRIERQVLDTIVFRLLGLGDARPHNAWTTNGVLATAAEASKRTVIRVLDRFEAWGILKRTSVPGRGGRICLHVPGVVGAAKAYKPAPLGDRLDDEKPSKRCHQSHLFSVEKVSRVSAKRCHRCHLNPIDEPVLLERSSFDRARGPAAERPPAGAGPGFENECGQEEGTLTRARARLLARLRGLAGKADLTVGPAFLDHLGPDRVARWLRLQREDSPRASATLVREALELLSDYLTVDPSDLATAVATAPKGDRKRKPSASSPPPKAAAAAPPDQPMPVRPAFTGPPKAAPAFAGARRAMDDPDALKASIARLNAHTAKGRPASA